MSEINCPKCGGTKIGIHAKDGELIKYKCKEKGHVFREGKNYNFNNKAEEKFAMALLNLINLHYSKLNTGSSKINFKNLLLFDTINKAEFDTMSFRLEQLDAACLRGIAPDIRLYLKNNEIIISKKLGN